MENQIFLQLKKRTEEKWLINYDAGDFYRLTLQFYQQFTQDKIRKKILLTPINSWNFLAAFLAGVAANCPVFLANPDLVKSEWQQVINLVAPALILTTTMESHQSHRQNLDFLPNYAVMIPTGGTSGKIRFAIHNWTTLTASVVGFFQYFDEISINSFCILPLYHVSGLMQFLRSFLTGGKFFLASYQTIKQKQENILGHADFFLSLVPTQLKFFLETSPHWLAKFQTVLLGGAPAWEELLNMARKDSIALAPSYGMTETAAAIVILSPADFLAGNNSNGKVLPHANLIIRQEKIIIRADSLFLGYYSDASFISEEFVTDDLGFLDAGGYLNIVGRSSDKIITGGENVFALEVEAVIRATKLVRDVVVIGIPDKLWGEVIVAIYIRENSQVTLEKIQATIQDKLTKFKQPKLWIEVDTIPRNQQGKINREQLLQLIPNS